MSKQIIAISLGSSEDKLTRKALHAYFEGYGFIVKDENLGLLLHPDEKVSFICSCFEKTNYILFKESPEQHFPSAIFDYILNLKDDTTIVSLGDEDEERWTSIQTDSEFTLKRFRKEWNKD